MNFQLDQLVCECPVPENAPGYLWYEADLDDPGHLAALASAPGHVHDDAPQVLGSTRQRSPETLARLLDSVAGGSRRTTHVQIECPPGGSRRPLQLVETHGLHPVPAWHCPTPPDSARELLDRVIAMTDWGTDIVKVVYPAHRPEVVRWTVDLLLDPPPGTSRLSLTPAGSRQARVAAALAGSSLVFAPLQATSERMSAPWYRELALAATTSDEGVQSWFPSAMPS